MNSTQTEPFENNVLTAAIFASITAMLIGAMYFASRIGFVNPPMPVIRTVGLALFLFCTPVIVRGMLPRRDRWYSSVGALMLLALALAVIGGLLMRVIPVDLGIIFALLGIISFGVAAVRWLASARLLHSLVFVIAVAGFAVWLASVIWDGTYHSPLYVEGLSQSLYPADTFSNAGIVSMIDTYGYPSAGLHGAPLFRYHTGSHWLFAQLAVLLGITPLTVYQLAYPVVFLPMLLYAELQAALEIRRAYSNPPNGRTLRTDALFWLVFFAVQIGFQSNHFYFVSESFAVGLMFLMLTLGLLARLIQQPEIRMRQFRDPSTLVFFLIVLPLLTFAMGMGKISMIAVLGFLCVYFFVRWDLIRHPIIVASLVMLGVSLFAVIVLAIWGLSQVGGARGYPFQFLFQYYPKLVQPFYFLLYYVLSWAFIMLRLAAKDALAWSEFKKRLLNNELVDVEIVAVTAVASTLPGAAGLLWSENYFSMIRHWVALVFLLAALPTLLPILRLHKSPNDLYLPTTVIAALLVSFTVLGLSREFIAPIAAFAERTRALRTTFSEGAQNQNRLVALTEAVKQGNIAEVRQVMATEIIPFLTSHQQYVERDPHYQVMIALEELGRLPAAERRMALLYVPKTNRAYWDAPMICYGRPFIGPALSGMAMLQGFPEAACDPHLDFGYAGYVDVERKDIAPDDDQALCAEAESLGYSIIWVVDAAADSEISKWQVRCGVLASP